MRWAGKPENIVNDCLAAAHVVNQSFDVPLPDAEVAATARSVNGYRVGWIIREVLHGGSASIVGRERQAMGVAKRRERTRDRDRDIRASSEVNAVLAAQYGLSVRQVQRIRKGA